jgi:hypothetical protein
LHAVRDRRRCRCGRLRDHPADQRRPVADEDKWYPSDPDPLQQRVALELEKYWRRNNRVLERMYWRFAWASALLGADVILWTIKLA